MYIGRLKNLPSFHCKQEKQYFCEEDFFLLVGSSLFVTRESIFISMAVQKNNFFS